MNRWKTPSFFVSTSFSAMHERTHTHTYTHSRVFLPLCGWPFLVHIMHRKLEVSLFMSVEKKRDHSFFGCCQLAHISLLCYQGKQNRGAHCSDSDTADSALGPQTSHTTGVMLQELTWTELILKDWTSFKNINTFLLNLEQIGFSYLFLTYGPASHVFLLH